MGNLMTLNCLTEMCRVIFRKCIFIFQFPKTALRKFIKEKAWLHWDIWQLFTFSYCLSYIRLLNYKSIFTENTYFQGLALVLSLTYLL